MAKFDEQQSDSFKFKEPVIDLHYGSADVYGYISQDQVCLVPESCADDFTFISVGMQTGLD